MRTTGQPQVGERLLIDGKEPDGRTIFGSHIGDGGAVGQGHLVQTWSKELNELTDHAVLAQYLGNAQHEIGRGAPFGQPADQAKTNDLRHEHIYRLAKHDRLGFDTADTPAEHAQSIDHRRMGVRADQRIRIQHAIGVPHDLGQVFKIHLVNDTGARRNHPEVVEGTLAPLEELVSLAIALELLFVVDGQRHAGVERIHLHGVIDNEIAWNEWIHLAGVTTHADHGAAHRGEIDHGGDAGEILENDSPGPEGDLRLAHAVGVVGGERLDVFFGDHTTVEAAQARFKQDLDGVRQTIDFAETAQRVKAMDRSLPEGGGERLIDTEGIAV